MFLLWNWLLGPLMNMESQNYKQPIPARPQQRLDIIGCWSSLHDDEVAGSCWHRGLITSVQQHGHVLQLTGLSKRSKVRMLCNLEQHTIGGVPEMINSDAATCIILRPSDHLIQSCLNGGKQQYHAVWFCLHLEPWLLKSPGARLFSRSSVAPSHKSKNLWFETFLKPSRWSSLKFTAPTSSLTLWSDRNTGKTGVSVRISWSFWKVSAKASST